MFMNTLVHELFIYVCLFGKINEQQTLLKSMYLSKACSTADHWHNRVGLEATDSTPYRIPYGVGSADSQWPPNLLGYANGQPWNILLRGTYF